MILWAVQWRSKNKADGETIHLLYRDGVPVLFDTRKKAREWIEGRYSYIKDRKDLKREPFGWRMPRAVKVDVTLEIE
jgi:hypothetical protein